MPTTDYTLELGAALTPTFGANASLIEQAIQKATPNDYRGFVIVSETTPATTGQPTGFPTNWYAWHTRCLWLKSSTGEVFRWTGTNWSLTVTKPGTTSVTNAMLTNSTIDIVKLDPTKGSPLQIPQINSGGTAVVYVNPATAIANTSLAVGKLIGGANPGEFYLKSTNGVLSWYGLDSPEINAIVGANGLEVNNLVHGTADQVLGTTTAGTGVAWDSVVNKIAAGSIALTKLAASATDASKYLRYNAGGTALEAVTLTIPVAPNFVKTSASITTLPTYGASGGQTVAHGLAGKPHIVTCMFQCTVIDNEYQVGDIIELSTLLTASGGEYRSAYSFSVDSTLLYLKMHLGTVWIIRKNTADYQLFTAASWKAVFNCIYFT